MGKITVKRKRTNKKNGFQVGNTLHKLRGSNLKTNMYENLPFKYLRLRHCSLEDLAGADMQLLDEDGQPHCNVRILRPLKNSRTALEEAAIADRGNEMDSYRIVHLEKVEEMYRTAGIQHKSASPDCTGNLKFDQGGEEQRGLAWCETLKCCDCSFRSGKFKLYREIDSGRPGRKAADINLSVHSGLSHTPIAAAGLSKIVTSMNIPPPSERQLQRNANKVGQILVEENTKHMQEIHKNLHEVSKLKGLSEDAPHDLEMDCRYNNPIYSGVGRTPFQAGTQVTQVVCEQTTSKKQIVWLTNKSKLCQTARLLERQTGKEVTCPHHPGHCSANLPTDAVIGMHGSMGLWVSNILRHIGKQVLCICFQCLIQNVDCSLLYSS